VTQDAQRHGHRIESAVRRVEHRVLKIAIILIAMLGPAGAPTPTWADDGAMRVTLLGTGTPAPSPDRFGYSTLVEAGGRKLLFDFGRGVTIRLAQLHIPFGTIDAHFLTHFHSDHLVGLPDLWLTGWLRPAYGSRNKAMSIYGPPGLKKLTDGLTTTFAPDIDIRKSDEHDPDAGIAFDVHEVLPGTVYVDSGIVVTAFINDHGPLVVPSYGYRIAYRGHSVVLSGDTRYSPEVIRQAKGADVLVHCVTVIPDELLKQFPAYQAIYQHLASPEDAGRVFAEARPKLAVYSHIGLNGNATEEDLIAHTRSTYDGALQVGHDLMSIDIGDQTTITVRP
jgi:ribonuclease Z